MIPPPPAVNPAALELEKPAPTHRRDQKVPAGFKRVYAPNQPHQGAKEQARRRKQMEGKS